MATDVNAGRGTPTSAVLLRGALLRVIALFVVILSTFLLMPYLVEHLGERGYGLWILVGAIVSYLGMFDAGLTFTVNRYLARAIRSNDGQEVDETLSLALTLFCVIGAVVLIASLIIATQGARWFDDPEEVALFATTASVLGLDAAIGFPAAALRAFITSHLRFDYIAALTIARTAIFTLAALAFAGHSEGVVWLAWITFTANLVERAYLLRVSRHLGARIVLGWPKDFLERVREMGRYTLYVIVAQLGDRIRFGLDTLIVAALVSLEAVTHYNIASRLTHYFAQLLAKALGVTTPVFAGYDVAGEVSQLKAKLLITTRMAVALCTVSAGALIIFGKPFIDIWMGKRFSDAYVPLVLLVTGMAFDVMQSPSTSMLYAIAKHRFYAFMNLGEALCNLTLSILLVGPFGLIGVAAGSAIPMIIVRVAVLPRYVCSQVGLTKRTYYTEAGRVLLISSLLQTPLWFVVAAWPPDRYFDILAIAALYYPVALMGVFFLALRREDREMSLGAIRRLMT